MKLVLYLRSQRPVRWDLVYCLSIVLTNTCIIDTDKILYKHDDDDDDDIGNVSVPWKIIAPSYFVPVNICLVSYVNISA